MITALEHLTFQCHNFGLSVYKLNLKKIESNMKYFNKFLLLHDRARNAHQMSKGCGRFEGICFMEMRFVFSVYFVVQQYTLASENGWIDFKKKH